MKTPDFKSTRMTFVRNYTPGTAFTYVGMKLNYVIGSGVEQKQTLLSDSTMFNGYAYENTYMLTELIINY